MKKKKILSVLLATAVAGSMVSVTAGCNVDNGGQKATTVFFAGDSTVCAFNESGPKGRFMPRYGYGTQFANYVSDKVTVKNLAASGTSSYSFTNNDNYNTLKTSIKAGDYLIIGFGHNDEASSSDDAATLEARYTDPTLAKNSTKSISELIETAEARPVSFKYNLYQHYIKMAQDKGATPILCTPIVRLSKSDDYDNANGHKTSNLTVGGVEYTGGDYAQAIRDLGAETGVTVIDLTLDTRADYVSPGYEQVKNRHSAIAARWADSSKQAKVAKDIDGTHTNYFGASLNAFYLASDLKKSSNSLGKYVNSDIKKPVYNEAFVVNSQYEVPDVTFNPVSDRSKIWENIMAPWYGTAFGDIGVDGKNAAQCYTVQQNSANNFTVGGKIGTDWVFDEGGETGHTIPKYYGKISSGSDGFAAAFYQLDAMVDFEITVQATLDVYDGTVDQTGFGIMLRDNIVIDERLDKDASIQGDYAAAGVYTSSKGTKTNVLFNRGDYTDSSNKFTADKLTARNSYSADNNKLDALNITQDSTHILKIKKVGKGITVSFDDLTYTYTTDSAKNPINLIDIDDSDMYLCLFATRGTTVTFDITDFIINNVSQLA